jgi:hypothetical protein
MYSSMWLLIFLQREDQAMAYQNSELYRSSYNVDQINGTFFSGFNAESESVSYEIHLPENNVAIQSLHPELQTLQQNTDGLKFATEQAFIKAGQTIIDKLGDVQERVYNDQQDPNVKSAPAKDFNNQIFSEDVGRYVPV